MVPAWVEAIVPCAIITVMVAGMGGLQGVVHKAFYGRPKAHGQDDWDRLIESRDERISKEHQTAQQYQGAQ
jgi:NADH dehydrogenase (ubiquinone) 1 alpha subcomplex subunit 1